MPKKTVTNVDKVKLVLSSLRDDVIITKFCVEHEVSRSTFYRWRKSVLVALSALVDVNKKPPRGKRTSWTRKRGLNLKKPRYRCHIE